MLYMAKLGPEVITEELNTDDEDPSSDAEAATETCVSIQCQKQIKGGPPALILRGDSDLQLDIAFPLRPQIRIA